MFNYDYTIYLCTIDKIPICIIDYKDISVIRNFRQFSELSFEVSYFDNGWIKAENKTFNLLQPNYLILLETRYNDNVINSEYFIINQPELRNDNGNISRVIKCYSVESIFNNRYLTEYEDVRVLYDPNNKYNLNDNTKGGILNYILESMQNIWTIGHIDSDLLGIYHSFKYSSQTYRSVIEDLESVYNCIFIFDTVNNKINIYKIDKYGEDTEIILSDSNYLKSLSCNIKNSEICTMLRVYGKDKTTIAEYNPTGLPYLYDFSYFLNNGYFSDSLKTALIDYNNLLQSKEGQFANYLSTLNTLRSNLLTKQNELVDLNISKNTIEAALDTLMDNNRRNTSSYNNIYQNRISVLNLIQSKENEIVTIENQINNVLNNIRSLNITLALENNFTSDQLKELTYYIFEGNLKLDSVDNPQLLYQYAKQYMKIKSTPPYDFTIDLVDLFSIDDRYIIDRFAKIKVGNYIYINCPELGFNYEPYRIVQISHSKNNNNLSIVISNKDKINTDLYNLEKLLIETPKEIDSLKLNKEDYSKYVEDANKILYNNSIIDVENNPIVVGNNFINKRGFLGNSLGSRNGAIKIQGDQIIFSPDGDFKEYYAILSSEGLYLETENNTSRVIITPEYGFQLDVFNPATNDFRNAIYVGLELGEPVVKIDNGYISLTHIESNVEVNRITLNPIDGIRIQQNISGFWKDTFYTDSNGNLTMQGVFRTGEPSSRRIEIDGNGLISYNNSNRYHGLYISAGGFTDLFLFNNGSAQFLIYDDGSVIDMYASLGSFTPGSSSPSGSKRFLSTSGNRTYPGNIWDFADATVRNLDGYATESYVDENFATKLSYNPSTKVLRLLNNDGDVISSVTLD